MFKFGEKRTKGAHGGRSSAPGVVVTGSSCGMGGGMGGGGGGGNSGGIPGSGGFGRRGGNYDINRYNPVHDNLEIGSIIEDWMPKDQSGLSQLWRLIYLRDAIVGPAVDLYSNLPYSDFRLMGIDDPGIIRIYEDTMDRLDIVTMMPELVKEFLTIGRFCASLVFNGKQGLFTDWTVWDPDFLRIEPIPLRGIDPKIDLVASPAFKNFLQSQDPRDLAAKETLPPGHLEEFAKHGTYKLDPLNTLFVARRASPYDYVGTSFLTRIVNFWALEKSLVESTVTNARRRTRAILHITAGIENLWEPTPDEMSAIAGLFIQADEDPVGGKVITRTGVETNEVSSGTEFWKLSDEWAFLTEGKMRALGISDAFLSGDATYNNMETALSVFMESLRTLRAYMDRRVFYERIFDTLARVHGFSKKGKGPYSRRAHSYQAAMKMAREDLLMPKIQWNKKLQPEGDVNFMEMLRMADEAGVPITLKRWAEAAGLKMEDVLAELEEDTAVRQKIAEWRKTFTGNDAMEQQVMSSVKRVVDLPVWDNSGHFLTLSNAEAVQVIGHFFANEQNMMKLTSAEETMRTVSGMVGGDTRKTELVAYLLRRVGVASGLEVPDKTVEAISEHLSVVGTLSDDGVKRKAIVEEFQAIARLSAKKLPASARANLVKTAAKGQDMTPFSPKAITGV